MLTVSCSSFLLTEHKAWRIVRQCTCSAGLAFVETVKQLRAFILSTSNDLSKLLCFNFVRFKQHQYYELYVEILTVYSVLSR